MVAHRRTRRAIGAARSHHDECAAGEPRPLRQLHVPARDHPPPRTTDGVSQPDLWTGAAKASSAACRVRRERLWVGPVLARTDGATRRLLGPCERAAGGATHRLLAAPVLRL